MFTGLIAELGSVASAASSDGDGATLEIAHALGRRAATRATRSPSTACA